MAEKTILEHLSEETVWGRLTKLQHEMRTIAIKGKVDIGKIKYDYITLNDLNAKLDAKLIDYNFILIQPLDIENGQDIIRTILIDAYTGNSIIESKTTLKPRTENNPQDKGSCITYNRRYAILALLGVCGDPDEDSFISNEDIKKRVSQETNLVNLAKLFNSLRQEQQEELKELFSNRKKELTEIEKEINSEILSNTEIK